MASLDKHFGRKLRVTEEVLVNPVAVQQKKAE